MWVVSGQKKNVRGLDSIKMLFLLAKVYRGMCWSFQLLTAGTGDNLRWGRLFCTGSALVLTCFHPPNPPKPPVDFQVARWRWSLASSSYSSGPEAARNGPKPFLSAPGIQPSADIGWTCAKFGCVWLEDVYGCILYLKQCEEFIVHPWSSMYMDVRHILNRW